MESRGDHREVNQIRYQVKIDEGTIGRDRGALWQGKEVESRKSEGDMSISMVDAEIDGEVPSPQNSPRPFHSLFLSDRGLPGRVMSRLE